MFKGTFWLQCVLVCMDLSCFSKNCIRGYCFVLYSCKMIALKEWAPLKVQHCRGLVKMLELNYISTHTTSKRLARIYLSSIFLHLLLKDAVYLVGSYLLISYICRSQGYNLARKIKVRLFKKHKLNRTIKCHICLFIISLVEDQENLTEALRCWGLAS